MQAVISHAHITSADGVSREARRSIGLPAAQGMKFLLLRNENEVLEGGKLLLPASEPANTSQLARRMQSTSSFHMTRDPRGFIPHFTTG